MADCYFTAIRIGGAITGEQALELFEAIESEAPIYSTETGETFEWDDAEAGHVLELEHPEQPWGHFEHLEAACRRLGLQYVRRSGDGDMAIFDGKTARSVTHQENEPTVTLKDILKLEKDGEATDLESLKAWLKLADFDPPPLTFTTPVPAQCSACHGGGLEPIHLAKPGARNDCESCNGRGHL